MLKWNYKSDSQQSTGYEDVKDILKSYTPKDFKAADDITKTKMIDDVLAIYRSKNIFPIIYFNEDGLVNEVKKCIKRDVVIEGNILNKRYLQGQALCRYMFPNMFLARVPREGNPSIYDRFYSDKHLKRAIKFALSHRDGIAPSDIRLSLEMTGQTPTNFNSMKAKAIFERYTPKNGVIYDFAAGYGGRMVGALTSSNNYTYLTVEPCSDTYTNLNRLGELIESVTKRKDSYKIHKIGSEDFKGDANSVDFAFSSPPYFNLELYSNEDTQCYIKYPQLDMWLEGYVRQTIKNIYYMLKPNCYYAVNIADFKVGSKVFNYVDKWLKISEEEGFMYYEEIYLKVEDRCQHNHKSNNNKKEGIFVFKKV